MGLDMRPECRTWGPSIDMPSDHEAVMNWLATLCEVAKVDYRTDDADDCERFTVKDFPKLKTWIQKNPKQRKGRVWKDCDFAENKADFDTWFDNFVAKLTEWSSFVDPDDTDRLELLVD